MPRSPLQPGPAKDHYHDALAVGQIGFFGVLGPWHVDYTDVGLDETGGVETPFAAGGTVPVARLPVGTMVLFLFAKVTTPFEDADQSLANLNLSVQPEDDPDNGQSMGNWSTAVDAGPWTQYEPVSGGFFNQNDFFLVTEDVVQIAAGRGALSTELVQGAADIYAVIGTVPE